MEISSESDSTNLRVASFSCYLDPAKDSLIRRVSGQEQSPSLVIKSPISVKPPPFHAKIKNGRTDAFSYLNSAGESLVFKVPAVPNTRDPASTFTFSQDHSKEGEISVFGADRYFNMKLEYSRESKKEGQIVSLPRVGSNITRPAGGRSLCSETSSWTSQTAMLKNLQRQNSYNRQKKGTTWRIFAGFGGCQVPCFDKKNDMTADQTRSKPTRSGTGSQRIKHLAPIPIQAAQDLTVEDEKLDEPGRKSLEVFGSSTSSRRDHIAANLERKLSVLTWDAIPSGKTQSTIESSTICDDMASDASSDLFEIENISGCINKILTSKVDQQDDISCMSPTSHYAPSEASIQWSVVTASAADYAAYLSENEESSASAAGDLISKTNATKTGSRNKSAGGGKEGPKIKQGGLLGCKSQKSVDVAEAVCRHSITEKVKH